MIRAVLDTNALASGFAGLDDVRSTPGEVIRLWTVGRFELAISAVILIELTDTFTKKYFTSRRSPAQIDAALELLRSEATMIVPTIDASGVASHPEDDHVLAAAVSAGVEYLVTGDRQLLRIGSYQNVSIVSPRPFLALLKHDQLIP